MFTSLKTLFHFLYHFFFIDQSNGMVSHTKFFSIVGYILWCILFPYIVIHGSEASMDFWLIFGVVIIGNRTLNVWMQNKVGPAADTDSTWKGVAAKKAAPKEAPSAAPVVPKTDDLV